MKVLSRCPVCERVVCVTRLSCPGCDINIEGRFSLCSFCELSDEQREFILTFLKARGNIKEVEKELGISYPTVRSKLDEILKALKFKVTTEEGQALSDYDQKLRLLERLRKGEISIEEVLMEVKRWRTGRY